MLTELANRVERLSEPSREVDAEIALSCGVVSEREGNTFYGHKDYSCMVLERDYYDIEGSAPELPAYTTSLDAAMTLVPEGLRFEVTTTGYKPGATVCGNTLTGVHEGSYAATPALALTAAALRGRASLLSEKGEG